MRSLKALPKAGADVIELGMPFTDPMADGPPIQAAGLRALKGGQTLIKTLALVRDFRKDDDDTPIVLMGYYNPIYIYGVDKFLVDAKAAGVDGLIVVDLPPEEDDELCLPALKAGLNFIRLATPTTDDKRLPAVLTNTSGFVYYVSITGITGAAAPDAGKVSAAVARIKRHTNLPVAVGFGVRDCRAAPAPSPPAPTASWSARRLSTCCAQLSMPTARPAPNTVKAVTDLVPDIAARRAFGRASRLLIIRPQCQGAVSDISGNWMPDRGMTAELDELDQQRRPAENPQHPAVARRRRTSGSNAPRPARWSSTRTSRRTSSSFRAPTITCASARRCA